MRRAAKGQHQIIGRIDQCRYRALACGDQAALHPLGRCAIGNAGNGPAVKRRAACRIIRADFDRARALASNFWNIQRLERANTRSRQIAGNTIDAHAIGAIGRDRHIKHRRCRMIIRKGHANRGIIGQFDNAFMRVAQFQLAHRTHHAIALDTANGALAQFHAIRRHDRTGQAQHALHPGPRIGRAADDLQRCAIASIDAKHLQLVRIGMRGGGQHSGHTEPGQLFRRVFNSFDLMADPV